MHLAQFNKTEQIQLNSIKLAILIDPSSAYAVYTISYEEPLTAISGAICTIDFKYQGFSGKIISQIWQQTDKLQALLLMLNEFRWPA